MSLVKKEIQEGIPVLKISRPEALNALNKDLLVEIRESIKSLEQDVSVKAFLLTGEGKAFVAGADIAAMSKYGEKEALDFSELGQNVFNTLEESRLVSIALLNGFALGGGMELALACDIRYASNKAKLGLPEVSLGLIPGFGGTQRLARLAGTGVAGEWIYSADMFTAEEAFASGVVNRVTEPDKLLEEGIRLAKSIQSRGGKAISSAKSVMRKSLDLGLEEGMKKERVAFSELFEKEESKEGMTAFLEKRKPDF